MDQKASLLLLLLLVEVRGLQDIKVWGPEWGTSRWEGLQVQTLVQEEEEEELGVHLDMVLELMEEQEEVGSSS